MTATAAPRGCFVNQPRWWTPICAMLANERGASAHTLRAYQRELHGFAAWLAERRRRAGSRADRAHADSRLPGNALRARIVEGLGGAGAGGHPQLVQVAGAQQVHRAECGVARLHAAAAQTSAARAVHRADESRGGFGARRCGQLAGARPGDSRNALRVRHPQRRADRR